MKNISTLHLEIFDQNRLNVWSKLQAFKSLGVLGGGTSLALQLGHRKSYDFDIFIQATVPKSLLQKVNHEFSFSKIITLVDQQSELTFTIDGKVKITFLYFPFPLLYQPVDTNSLNLINIKDIASNKAYVIGRRGTWRDYVDLYWLLSEKKMDLTTIIAESEKRFEGNFSTKLFLQQLVYWEDIDDYAVTYLHTYIKPEIIKEYFQDLVKKKVNEFLR